jgi:hypothetical protein
MIIGSCGKSETGMKICGGVPRLRHLAAEHSMLAKGAVWRIVFAAEPLKQLEEQKPR